MSFDRTIAFALFLLSQQYIAIDGINPVAVLLPNSDFVVYANMILEGLVTSLNAAGELNLAPMGPIVNESMTRLVLRPFQTSTTFQNLRQRPCGVFHVTDDVLLIAQAALHRLDSIPETFPAESIDGRVLSDCCRWYEFEVVVCDDSAERTRLEANVVHAGRVRDMAGLNRARHAVLEATILATRLHLIPEAEVRSQLQALASPVEKTAGPREREAFALVLDVVDQWYQPTQPPHADGKPFV